MISLTDNLSNGKNGKGKFLDGFKSGIHIVDITDLKFTTEQRGMKNIYNINLELTINKKQYKFVRLTPFRIDDKHVLTPSTEDHCVADIIRKLRLLGEKVARQDVSRISGNTLGELIDNFCKTINYKGRCAMYIEKREGKGGFQFLCIPPAFGNTVVISSRASEINFQPLEKKKDNSSAEPAPTPAPLPDTKQDTSDLPF